MIGHETGGVNCALELRGQGLQVCEVKFVVGIGEEAGATVVAALNDVDRDLGDGDPGTAGMGASSGGGDGGGRNLADRRGPSSSRQSASSPT